MADEEKAAEVQAAAQSQAQATSDTQAVSTLGADDPMAKAVANGYKEEPPPSLRARVEAMIASFEHAMAHNAPVTPAMMAEMKALLLGNE